MEGDRRGWLNRSQQKTFFPDGAVFDDVFVVFMNGLIPPNGYQAAPFIFQE